ncbi:MAG TPA: hypothetical protein EYM30_03165, partial [Verrucomicrobia bacterium]|nr:hypothetical protein [Verrucomicrobiota bacterium]
MRTTLEVREIHAGRSAWPSAKKAAGVNRRLVNSLAPLGLLTPVIHGKHGAVKPGALCPRLLGQG